MKDLFSLFQVCLLGSLMMHGCASDTPPQAATGGAAPAVAPLPVAVSNNAVALVEFADHFRLYSFLGLTAGKTWRDLTDRAFEYDSRTDVWSELPAVPGGAGRLAATAEVVAGQIYLFGGYTVAEDGNETSTAEVFRFDPVTRVYAELPPMPVPVDDAVSAVYRDRYVYLVSGWHDIDNVADVQLLDVETESWLAASPYPGPPVFGHAGALAGSTMVVCDGVTVIPPINEAARRQFAISAACYRGAIDPVDPTRIDWRSMSPHPGAPTYRAGAGVPRDGPAQIIFAGGTDRPYNYNGIGYDGMPARPSDAVFGYGPESGQWRVHATLPTPSMDHRGLPTLGDWGFLIGGLDGNRQPRAAVTRIALTASG